MRDLRGEPGRRVVDHAYEPFSAFAVLSQFGLADPTISSLARRVRRDAGNYRGGGSLRRASRRRRRSSAAALRSLPESRHLDF